MFGWASQQIEKISQTMAPPPEDPQSRFVLACQKGNESEALQLLYELPGGAGTVVQTSTGQVPLHIACLYSLAQVVEACLSQPGADLHSLDGNGNTPLHCASMSSSAQYGLAVVQTLIQKYGASVVTKNSHGQTPYDVAKLNGVRQYLLPLQLQQETQQMIDNGGAGLPPGIDMGGLKIANSHLPPPPQSMPNFNATGGGAARYAPPPMPNQPAAAPAQYTVPNPVPATTGPFPTMPTGTTPNMQATAAAAQPAVQSSPAPAVETPPVASAPSSAPYARSGQSSAAVLSSAKYRPDGFHSSSSDKSLQRKYGHSSGSLSNIPPPPSSGSGPIISPTVSSSTPSPTSNPFAGGAQTIHRKGGSQYYTPPGMVAPQRHYSTPLQQQVAPQYTTFAPAPMSAAASAPAVSAVQQAATPYGQPHPQAPLQHTPSPYGQPQPAQFQQAPAPTQPLPASSSSFPLPPVRGHGNFPVPPVRGGSVGAAAPSSGNFPVPPMRQGLNQASISTNSAASVFSNPSSTTGAAPASAGTASPVAQAPTNAANVFASTSEPHDSTTSPTANPSDSGSPQRSPADVFGSPTSVPSSAGEPKAQPAKAAADLFGSNSNSNDTTGLNDTNNVEPEEAKKETAATGDGDEGLDDVPLSPEAQVAERVSAQNGQGPAAPVLESATS